MTGKKLRQEKASERSEVGAGGCSGSERAKLIIRAVGRREIRAVPRGL